ncbi:MAG: TMEM14 family protein [Chlamydiales bacterium]|nr:TMEM14 family protein [Chlamydiales bacterium]
MNNLHMNRFDTLITAYSLLLLIGGVAGYFMAGSMASLLMSTIFAILLISSLFFVRISSIMGNRVIFSLLSILIVFFGYRGLASAKFMPSGMLCILTAVILGFAISWRKKTVST